MSEPGAAEPEFQPYVPASQSMAELTPKAIAIGVVFGVIFGAATVYLALKAGLTVSASIPIAVLSISLLRRLGGSTILENNIVQTIALERSAVERIAVARVADGVRATAVRSVDEALLDRRLLDLRLHPAHRSWTRSGTRSEKIASDVVKGEARLDLEYSEEPFGPWTPLATIRLQRVGVSY